MASFTPYIDVAEADSYFEEVGLDVQAWNDADDVQRLKALKRATRDIDRLNFSGRRTAVDQPNEFPRDPGTTVPTDIQYACCEIALALLDGIDPNLEEESLNTITDAYATVRSTFDPTVRQDHIRAGIHSVVAWKLLLPYLNDPYSIRVRRG